MGKGIRFTVWRNDTLFGNENENTDVGGKEQSWKTPPRFFLLVHCLYNLLKCLINSRYLGDFHVDPESISHFNQFNTVWYLLKLDTVPCECHYP